MRPHAGGDADGPAQEPVLEPGLADVVTLQRRQSAALTDGDEESFFLDTVAEYQWARDAAGLAVTTLDRLVKPVIEICQHYDLVPWRLTPRQVDRYFAGPGKRGRSTVRQKMNQIDHYFAFLEQRYAGEIARRFGAAVESPIDPFNRPKHRGDFGLRVPPSQRAAREFFARWRNSLEDARKPVIARRDYVMGKLTYISGVRAAELCGVCIGDVHWESGQWGRFLVNGKGARGSGPRRREAYLFQEGRDLLWWYIEEVRGEFSDDPEDPRAPLFPSERLPPAVAALNMPTPGIAVTPSTFRKALKTAGQRFLTGPVTHLYPHLLRHAAATRNYERGMSLWEVQKMLGHDRPTTTVSYLATAHADPEAASLAASGRAVQRLVMDKGNLR
ncbi:tyrosine-type recombinase/integrase [Streptomyces sp. NPDC058424]|uniref:tyrosine-type recombinase/integrase n=1 Tax=Streptomyces sp. NPDC058424 TaxID=3346491 RepID=UPI00364B1D67